MFGSAQGRCHMNRFRLLALVVGALIIVAVAGMAIGRGGEHEGEEGDADRDAAAHVASPKGYEKHNAVRVVATAPAAGWVGEARLATEDRGEPYIAADPAMPFVYAIYNRYGVSCAKSSCPNPQMMVRV